MSGGEEANAQQESALQTALAVKRAHEDELMGKANVVGVGVGLRQRGGTPTDDVVLVVMVQQKVPRDQLDPDDVIPSEIKGVPVDVQEVGKIVAQG